MKEVYFDTNVYTHVDGFGQKKIFAPLDKLRRAIRSDHLRVYTSLMVIEETIGALMEYPAEGQRRLRLIRRLAKRRKMLRMHFDILEDDVHSYATGQRFKSHFMAPFPQLKDIFHVRDLPGLLEVAKKTKESNRQFRDRMRTKYSTHIAPLAEPIIDERQMPSFEEYFNDNATNFLEVLVKKTGDLDACQAKGREGLLSIPSTEVVTRAQLSLTYANTYLGRQQQQGDSRDMQHAQYAAAIGTLVTQDTRLIKLLRRANSPYLEVMNLEELLDKLPSATPG
jgi:hypothetical protein